MLLSTWPRTHWHRGTDMKVTFQAIDDAGALLKDRYMSAYGPTECHGRKTLVVVAGLATPDVLSRVEACSQGDPGVAYIGCVVQPFAWFCGPAVKRGSPCIKCQFARAASLIRFQSKDISAGTSGSQAYIPELVIAAALSSIQLQIGRAGDDVQTLVLGALAPFEYRQISVRPLPYCDACRVKR